MAANGNGGGLVMPTTKRLEGKVAIITGAARGIGAACAKKFAENGAKVIVADILDEVGRKMCRERIGCGAEYIHCDVSKEEEVAAMVERAVECYGRLDIMFNNAGVPGRPGSIMNVNMKQVEGVIGVNMKGTMHGIKHAARAMVAGKRGGCILCTTSSATVMGGLGSHEYTMSKEGIMGLVRTAACELGEYGIRVNCISPHGVASEMLVEATREVVGNKDVTAREVSEQVASEGSMLQGRSATEEDIAAAALFLASDQGGGFISAHNLLLDGGFTSGFRNMRMIYHPHFDNYS